MTDNALQIAPARISVDPTHDGNILIVAIDDGLEDSALWLTPATAAKLGQRLVNDERQGDLDGAPRVMAPSRSTIKFRQTWCSAGQEYARRV